MAISIQEPRKGELPPEVQDEISLAKTQLGETFESQKQAIDRIGRALQKVLADKPHKICAHIKFVLREYVDDGLISERTIERLCPDEWKNPAKAEAGREGAVKLSAKRRVAVAAGVGSGSDDSGENNDERLANLESKVREMQTTLEAFMPKFNHIKDNVIREGGYVKIPENEWDELIRSAPIEG